MEYKGITNFTNYRARALETFITANDVFTPDELESTLNAVKNPKHRAL